MPSAPVKASTSPARSLRASISPICSVSSVLCDKNCIGSPPDPFLPILLDSIPQCAALYNSFCVDSAEKCVYSRMDLCYNTLEICAKGA